MIYMRCMCDANGSEDHEETCIYHVLDIQSKAIVKLGQISIEHTAALTNLTEAVIGLQNEINILRDLTR